MLLFFYTQIIFKESSHRFIACTVRDDRKNNNICLKHG